MYFNELTYCTQHKQKRLYSVVISLLPVSGDEKRNQTSVRQGSRAIKATAREIEPYVPRLTCKIHVPAAPFQRLMVRASNYLKVKPPSRPSTFLFLGCPSRLFSAPSLLSMADRDLEQEWRIVQSFYDPQDIWYEQAKVCSI